MVLSQKVKSNLNGLWQKWTLRYKRIVSKKKVKMSLQSH